MFAKSEFQKDIEKRGQRLLKQYGKNKYRDALYARLKTANGSAGGKRVYK
ncbi:MAG: hypothetical protein LBV16_01560 [Elusimicrobiota bacterium]|nr:hypothetical protein [Elusimicrobiota bacterium]